MATKRKQNYIVHYSITGYVGIDVEAEDEDEAIRLADDALAQYDFWNSEDVQFEQKAYQVINEKGDVVWGMS